jgi:hypothetical protein
MGDIGMTIFGIHLVITATEAIIITLILGGLGTWLFVYLWNNFVTWLDNKHDQ